MRESLPISLRLMFGHEGGYSNRKTDRGGPTKYGITHRTLAAHRGVPSVTAEQVRALTLAEAETIYRKSYWTQSGGDALPKGLDYAAFDFGVNSGPHRAVKVLQRVVGVKEDGWVGEITLKAVRNYPGGIAALIIAYCAARMAFLRSLTNPKTGFPVNGRGWTIRVTGKDPRGEWPDQLGVVGNALQMAAGETTAPVPTDPEAGTPEGGDCKAEPSPKSPWQDPSVILPGAGGLLAPLGALLAGTGPVQWAFALAILAAVGVGVYFAYQHIKALEATK